MKAIILILSLITLNITCHAQETPVSNAPVSNNNNALNSLLSDVASNNKRLKALRELSDAQKVSNKTGLNPENPAVEFNYLWGEQPIPGDRKDIRIVQSFDFPSSYGQRSNIAKLKNKQSDYEYRKEYLSVMHSATILYVELVYLNSYIAELNSRTANLNELAKAMEVKLRKGDANILEYNKAFLNFANQQQLLNEQMSRLRNVSSELEALNGGKAVEITDQEPYLPIIETDFEKWHNATANSNPDIQWMEEESLINAGMVKLNTSLSLPKFTAGYMSENLPQERFSGVTVGMSIPLWENRNLVKSAKLKSIASQDMALDMKQQFNYKLRANHEKVITLLTNAKKYRTDIESHTNAEFLKKAFDSGEISLIEYLTELTFYYQSIDQMLNLEREAGIAAAELLYYER